MQIVLLLEIVSIGLIFGGLEAPGIILLSFSVLYGIYFLFKGKKKESPEAHKYIFTYNAIMNENLSQIVEHGIIEGDFYVSTKIVSDKRSSDRDFTKNDILFDNLSALKKNGRLMYVNSGSNISEILSYAYKNDCSVVSSNENISKKILQIFSVKVIDIGFLKKSYDINYRKGDILTVYVAKKTEEGFRGLEAKTANVILDDMSLTENTFIEAEVEKVLEISGEKTIYANKRV
ncbi:MAG: hypothetical protein AB7T10_06475 [bacterium]